MLASKLSGWPRDVSLFVLPVARSHADQRSPSQQRQPKYGPAIPGRLFTPVSSVLVGRSHRLVDHSVAVARGEMIESGRRRYGRITNQAPLWPTSRRPCTSQAAIAGPILRPYDKTAHICFLDAGRLPSITTGMRLRTTTGPFFEAQIPRLQKN